MLTFLKQYYFRIAIFISAIFVFIFFDQLMRFAGWILVNIIIQIIALILYPFVDPPQKLIKECIPEMQYTSTKNISFYIFPKHSSNKIMHIFPTYLNKDLSENDQPYPILRVVDKSGEDEIIENAKNGNLHYVGYKKLPSGTILTTTGEIIDINNPPFASRHIRVRGIIEDKVVWFSMYNLQEFSENEENTSNKNYINNTILNISDNQYIGDSWECLNN